MKTTLIGILAACLVFLSLPIRAQEATPPPPPERLLEAVQRILDLSDSQVQQLVDLRESHRQDMQALRTQVREEVQPLITQVRELEKQKAELLESSNPDPAQVGAIVIQQRALRKQVQEARKPLQDANQSYHEAALALLTETQKEKVAQIQRALRLAPQAGPLAAFGLIERPRPRRPFRRRLGQRMGMAEGPHPMGPGPSPFRLLRKR